MSADRIVLTDAAFDESHHLRNRTALLGCTSVDGDAFVKAWPRLSSGEELLWAVLGWLNGVCDLPTSDTLRAGLDGGNFAVVRDLVGATA